MHIVSKFSKLPLLNYHLRKIPSKVVSLHCYKNECKILSCALYATNSSSLHPDTVLAKQKSSGYNSKEKTSSLFKLLNSGTLFLAGFGLGFLLSSNNKADETNGPVICLPSVKAALPSDPPDGLNGSRRHNFNFIADVVRTCGPSVVYIEIIDPRFNR